MNQVDEASHSGSDNSPRKKIVELKKVKKPVVEYLDDVYVIQTKMGSDQHDLTSSDHRLSRDPNLIQYPLAPTNVV